MTNFIASPFKFHQCYLGLYEGEQTRYEIRWEGKFLGYVTSEYVGETRKTRWVAWTPSDYGRVEWSRGVRIPAKTRADGADALYCLYMKYLYPHCTA